MKTTVKHILLTFATLLTYAFSGFDASAYEQEIRSIRVDVLLRKDGSATITETWDVAVAGGTEWYLVRQNLGPIEISGLSVTDLATGAEFVNIGEWDSRKSLEQKKDRCGVVHKGDGLELCWGIGSYGDHLFQVRYEMSNVVEALDDSDIFHLQLVSPGLSANPHNVLAFITSEEVKIDETNTLGWGFGFVGESFFGDGSYVLTSVEEFDSESSVIVLMKFDKGMFSPATAREGTDFMDVYEMAMEDADFPTYEEEEEQDQPWWMDILGFIAATGGIMWYMEHQNVKKQKKVLGCKIKDIDWYREIPLDGNLYASSVTLVRISEPEYLPAAMVMRMIRQGVLSASKDADGLVQITFNDDKKKDLDPLAAELYDMMRQASGTDKTLQYSEFSSWADSHWATVIRWNDACFSAGFNPIPSKEEARKLLGFRKYLSEFTISGEREVKEVFLWDEMLVFGALFGVAERVVTQLQDINTDIDVSVLNETVRISNTVSTAISSQVSSSSRSGYGGHGGSTSRGGGGGHRGGGHGGGSR